MKASTRENQALRFIASHIAEFGHPPYQFQIAAHFKTDSRGFICRMLDSMERKGMIERRYGVRRSITLKQYRGEHRGETGHEIDFAAISRNEGPSGSLQA
jgi:hypothetical protein